MITWATVLALVFLSIAVYWNSRHNPLTFDDWHVISDNPAIRDLASVPSFFRDVSTFSILPGNRDYRPLFMTSMALAWWAGEGDVVPFHLMSMALHAGSVVLLFLIARRSFLLDIDRDDAHRAALLAAALFAVHPLATESINYISSQAVPLATMFYLLAFHAFLLVHGLEPTSGRVTRVALHLVGGAAYALALLSKPIAITLPVVLLLWEILRPRTAPVDGEGTYVWRVLRQWRTALTTTTLRLIPYGAITVAFLLVRRAVIPAVAAADPVRSPWVHYLTETKALVFYYLGAALWPARLNVDREYPLAEGLTDGAVLVSLLIVLVIAALLFLNRRHRALIFWSLWFPVGLFLTTYGVVLGQVVNEHRVYLSLVGFCAVAGFLLVKLLAHFPSRVAGGARAARVAISVAVLLLLGTFASWTRARNEVWSSELALWADAAAGQGTWRAHMNHGLALHAAGRGDESLAALERAVQLGPYAWAHMNLGLGYLRHNQMELGLEHLHTATRLWPTSPETHFYLAYGLERIGDDAEAESELRRAVALRPDYIRGHRKLGRFYEDRGDLGRAISSYERLAELDPAQDWPRNRAELLRGRMTGTLAAREAAYRSGPVDHDALFALGFEYQKLRRIDDAIRLYDELLVLDPLHRQGTFNLAHALLHGATRQQWARSAELFGVILEIDPEYTEALYHLAGAHWNLGDEEAARRYDGQYLERGEHAGLLARSRERLAARN